MQRLLIAAVVGFLSALFASAAAIAADEPVAREPGVQEVRPRAPSAVTLAFAWELAPEVVRIFVLDDEGNNVTNSAPHVDGTNAWVLLDIGIGEGTYTVYYQANNKAGEPIGGAYQFAVGAKGKWTPIDDSVWKGYDDQPVIFQGGNPNEPATEDDLKAQQESNQDLQPGLEIVREDGTVENPQGETAPAPSSHRMRWIITGTVAVLGAAAGVWVWQRRKRRPRGRRVAR